VKLNNTNSMTVGRQSGSNIQKILLILMEKN